MNALVDRFPRVGTLPHVALCDLPTPLEPFGLDVAAGSLRIKRDDVTARAYGGNKARKLEYLLGDAVSRGCRAVITFGAYGSNHALATAVHARALGLEPHAVLSPQAPGPFAARTLRAHAGIGTVLHPVEGWDGTREAVRVRRELLARDGVEPAVVPMGGTNALGAVAYVAAAFELGEQLGGELPDVIYVPAGTVGTAVGLAVGLAALGAATRVEAVRVTPREVCDIPIAERLAYETVALVRSVAPEFPALDWPALRFTMRDEYFEPGYGVVTPETTQVVEAARDAGASLETTYTGKALLALVDDARAGRVDREDVVFWNTYNSAPLPEPGPDTALPPVLAEYVDTCDRLYGAGGPLARDGDRE